mgnify:CR=1 FL=1
MNQAELIPNLFRTEYRKISAVLCKLFGIEHIEVAEDIVSETFLAATETWGHKGLPENPTAWLYTVAKNKAKNYLRHQNIFDKKVKQHLGVPDIAEPEVDLSEKNIEDSQLAMIFAICQPSIPAEAQIGLALRILCGFGIEEIATAFLTSKETINKRLFRAKEKLREENVKIEFPGKHEIPNRLDTVLTTLYLLFNEGYYSLSQDTALRKDLCLEAMRLTHLLAENELTKSPSVYALLALMCFQASRFDARQNENGETILYQDQDARLWDMDFINKGIQFLMEASQGNELSKYQLEAGIAFCHTQQADTKEKWNNILQLYNQLLMLQYSPMAALNRTYALYKVFGKEVARAEAEQLNLEGNLLYHSLLGELYRGHDNEKAIEHFQKVIALSKSPATRAVHENKIEGIRESSV